MLTAEELGIPKPIVNGLIKFVQLAEAGEIEHDPDPVGGASENAPATKFNMKSIRCGSCGCIKGWLPQLMGVTAYGLERLYRYASQRGRGELHSLFYPSEYPVEGHPYPYDAKPRWAAATIKSLLETGKTDWQANYRPD